MAKRWSPEHLPPITLGGFRLVETGVEITGRPDWGNMVGAWAFAKRANRSAGFWLADLMRYARKRPDWAGKLSQLIDHTGLSAKTVKNIEAVGAIPPSRRRDDVEFGHHEVVAPLEPEEQVAWLERAAEHGWNVRELRMEIRAAKRRKVIEGQAVLEGKYRVWMADPPWLYSDSGPTADGSLGKAERHYPGMTIEQLCQLPVAAHTTPDAVLFLWCTAPMLLTEPGPREVIKAWGFTYKTSAVWDKVLGNFGHYFHVRHEHLLVCTRGSCLPDQPTPQPDSIFVERRSDVHSQKPESIRKIIERLYTVGPYVELFARERVEGWACFGNDARLWSEEPAISAAR